MRNFLHFAYICLAIFAVLSAFGALAYEGEWVFAVAALLMGAWIALDFFGVKECYLPVAKAGNQFRIFLLFIVFALNCVGSVGYLIYHGYALFAIAVLILVTVQALQFGGLVILPHYNRDR